MRDTKSWCKKLCQSLRKSEDIKDYVAGKLDSADAASQNYEIVRLARLIAEIELGLTLLKEVAPEDPASSVEALLKGYRFPVEHLQSDNNWHLVQSARFYLFRRKGREWKRSLSEYMQIPEILRIYSLQDTSSVPQLILSSTCPRRLVEIYQPTLSKTPPHSKHKVNLATTGRWFCKISQNGHSPVEIPIDIPKAVANIAPSPLVSFLRTRNAQNAPHSVTLEELVVSAGEMDSKLVSAEDKPKYYDILQKFALQVCDTESDDFQPGSDLQLEQLIHIVGLLNVGKSTLLEILIYHFAKLGCRCALIVNDVVAAVRIASLFSHKLEIPAAPVLGKERSEQLEKVYESILESQGEEITRGGRHPAWRWFSPVCPLLGLVRSGEHWKFGQEPCHDLYQKVPASNNNNSEASDAEDWEEEDEKYSCPLYYKCPRHQLEKDIAQAFVWVLTPASLIHTRVPRQVLEENLTFAEAVYRECEFLFVDEADRVQVQFDEAFAPDEVLVDGSENSLLNKIGINAATIYNSDRSNMAADRFVAWTSAQYYVQNATNRIYHLLLTQPKLVEWLGQNPFTGRSLFARLIRDVFEPERDEESSTTSQKTKQTRQERMEERRRRIVEGNSSQEQRDRRTQLMQSLDKFFQYPLNRRRGGELSELAFALLSAESDRAALTEVAEWCKKWLQENQISLVPPQFEELIRNAHLAILTTVLEDRLSFLIDRLSEIDRVIDLRDISRALVNRPPRDYLPVVPESPVGNILGFRYIQNRRSPKKGGRLDYFRYVGVGRALLLNFPKLFAADNWDGPHTVLISGTSYAPGSPAYHVSIKPTVLLEPVATNEGASGSAGIGDSEFLFSPQKNSKGDWIALSGLPPAKRQNAAEELVKAMCNSPGKAPCFLDDLFEELQQRGEEQPEWWSDRQRILIVAGSYEESAWVESKLQPIYRLKTEEADGIVTLRRDNAPPHLNGLRRGEIQNLKDTPIQIVIAPLMALERGYNILNSQDKAAFGAALFLNRPMPVPDDWQSTVRQINAWALENESNATLYETASSECQTLTLADVGDCFYRNAVAEMLNLNCTAWAFKQLTEDERDVLCWTQLVSIWQIVGRLVRGGVPAIVHFMDVKFAPNSANMENDSETSSLLAGIIKVLEASIEDERLLPWEKTLARSLYQLFLNALKKTEGLYLEL